jgi:hypothetical protein
VPYFERDLAFIHDRGYGLHGDRCAPGILDLLAPVRGGLVLELGCGSGALTSACVRSPAARISPERAGRVPPRQPRARTARTKASARSR